MGRAPGGAKMPNRAALASRARVPKGLLVEKHQTLSG